jgi:hypothetical protein
LCGQRTIYAYMQVLGIKANGSMMEKTKTGLLSQCNNDFVCEPELAIVEAIANGVLRGLGQHFT